MMNVDRKILEAKAPWKTTMRTYIFLLPAALAACFAGASPCSVSPAEGTTCQIEITRLKPTQFSVGLREVRAKAAELASKSAGKLATYLSAHPAPVVLASGGQFYITDHHHLASALLQIHQTQIWVQIESDQQTLTDDEFWHFMQTSHLTYLYDNHGAGPLAPRELPSTIAQMSDDPYRSLAGTLLEDDCYQKTMQPFAEFLWAEYLRSRVDVGTTDAEYARAVQMALPHCHVPAAANLPGYIPPLPSAP